MERVFKKQKLCLQFKFVNQVFSNTHLNKHSPTGDSSAISWCLFKTESFPFYLFEQHFIVKNGPSPSDLARPYALYHQSKYLLFSGLSLVLKKQTVCLKAHCWWLWYTPLVEVNQDINSLVVLDNQKQSVGMAWQGDVSRSRWYCNAWPTRAGASSWTPSPYKNQFNIEQGTWPSYQILSW